MFFPYRDDNPQVIVPYVTYTILGINIIAFLIQMASPPEWTYQFAIIPKMATVDQTHFGLTLFSSMFLHGGIVHLAGNMLYLWIFADNVEGILGHTRFIFFYLLCGLASGLVQTMMDPGSTVPVIGASGAIAGVLGAYMITFPQARVHAVLFLFWYITTVRIPAVYVLGFWFLIQVTSGLTVMGINTTGGVAWFAHIGGFVAGIAFIRLLTLIRLEEV